MLSFLCLAIYNFRAITNDVTWKYKQESVQKQAGMNSITLDKVEIKKIDKKMLEARLLTL